MQKQPQLSPEKYIVTKGASLPFHECFINTNWEERGMASVLVSKVMPSGKYIIGSYLIDVCCLGLKSTFFKFAVDETGYSAFLEKMNESDKMEKCGVAFVHNLIYGAIDYAEDLGFQPDKDFKITEHLLDSDLIDDGIDQLEFGKNGKPLFVAGPYDNVQKVIAILERNVGAGNYDYILPA